MSAIGPDLPPHLLAKRKRQQEEETVHATTTASGANGAASPDGSEKRRKIAGPAMPPAPLDERPDRTLVVSEEESSDDDDDIGPSLPAGGAVTQTTDEGGAGAIESSHGTDTQHEASLKRDDWMMMPPTQDDLAARMDPTKQRPRGFNTGKGAKGPNAAPEDYSTWHETPEQKRKRLQNEIMGVGNTSTSDRSDPAKRAKSARESAAHRKIQEHNEKRGPSLLEQHKASKGSEAEDDDPSKRAFDREKDMGSGARISSTQKRAMLNKAAGFSGKFSGGTYL